MPFIVKIQYHLENPRTGLMFIEPDPDVAPYVSYLSMGCFVQLQKKLGMETDIRRLRSVIIMYIQ